jgi:hypothetical protein
MTIGISFEVSIRVNRKATSVLGVSPALNVGFSFSAPRNDSLLSAASDLVSFSCTLSHHADNTLPAPFASKYYQLRREGNQKMESRTQNGGGDGLIQMTKRFIVLE